MEATPAKALIDAYIKAYNKLDVPAMLACLHPEVQFEHVANGIVTMRLNGKAAFEAQATRAAAWFSERSQRVTAFHWHGSRAEVAIDYCAVTATELPDGTRPGTALQFAGRSSFSFRNNLIASIQDVS